MICRKRVILADLHKEGRLKNLPSLSIETAFSDDLRRLL